MGPLRWLVLALLCSACGEAQPTPLQRYQKDSRVHHFGWQRFAYGAERTRVHNGWLIKVMVQNKAVTTDREIPEVDQVMFVYDPDAEWDVKPDR